jgi:hypothetical protein
MIEIDFSGWFQCRLATDPDAYDDPRGQSGWTFALPGEPDLDRIIRFQNPIAPRTHGPTVDVRVNEIRVDHGIAPGHPLVGALVMLLDNPVFEGRNGEIASSAQEPIVPFAIEIRGGSARIIGRDPIDLTDPAEIGRRQPNDFIANSPAVAAATGIVDRAAFRLNRRTQLTADLVRTTDPIERAALQKRIDELGMASIRLTSLGFQLTYEFELRGPNDWQDTGGIPGAPNGGNPRWSTRYWLGAWDADSLCGFVHGTLQVG